jgi:hypothetical protein
LKNHWKFSGLSGVASLLLMRFSGTGDSIPDAVFSILLSITSTS